MYVRKEAVLSSQIEGTQSSLSDLLLYERQQQPSSPREDVAEVSRYVAAMNHGLKRLREDNFPLSLRLIREMHEKLLTRGRGAAFMPGEFRKLQNRIGGTRLGDADYVPPPPDLVPKALAELEQFLHAEEPPIPLLLRAGLVHVQFESIHPFLDGNGRMGRLLIPFLLCARGAIRQPMLYPSLYFKQHRSRYYDLLQRVRTEGDWESWLQFFLAGISETAEQAAATAAAILRLLEEDRAKLSGLGRTRLSALHVHSALQKVPIFSIPEVEQRTGLVYPTVARAVAAMARLGMVQPFGDSKKPALFAYQRYLDLLQEGTDPLPR